MSKFIDFLKNENPLIDKIQTLYNFQVIFFFFIVLWCLSIFIHHFKWLTCLFVHEGFTETFIGFVEYLSTEVALTSLLEHEQFFEYSCSLMEVYNSFSFLFFQLFLYFCKLCVMHLFVGMKTLFYSISLWLNFNQFFGSIISIFIGFSFFK